MAIPYGSKTPCPISFGRGKVLVYDEGDANQYQSGLAPAKPEATMMAEAVAVAADTACMLILCLSTVLKLVAASRLRIGPALQKHLVSLFGVKEFIAAHSCM